MKHLKLIDAMERFGGTLPALVHSIEGDDARWKPSPNDWSILEVVRHLGDEEVEDFRTRIRMTLEDSKQEWPSINPVEWATQRSYNECSLKDAVDRWVMERRKSIEWLRSLKNVDWTVAYHHPKIGPVHAGELLTAWAAHDAMHLRQIAKRMFQLAARYGEGYPTKYAGEW